MVDAIDRFLDSSPAYNDNDENVLPSSLQISIVTHRPDLKLLERCLRKLALAIAAGQEAGVMRTVHLALIDNSEDRTAADGVIKLGKTRFQDTGVHVTYLHGHANIGYGAAHNLVLHGTGSDYHLVLNPDVELAPDALANGVRWLNDHPDVGALAPLARDGACSCASGTLRSSTCSCADSPLPSCGACSSGVSTATRCATSSATSRRRT